MTREQFYNSSKWRKLSKMFLQSKYYICEQCGGIAAHAHHVEWLNGNDYSNPVKALNTANLQAVCISCHDSIHGAGSAIAEGLTFNENGDIVKVG